MLNPREIFHVSLEAQKRVFVYGEGTSAKILAVGIAVSVITIGAYVGNNAKLGISPSKKGKEDV